MILIDFLNSIVLCVFFFVFVFVLSPVTEIDLNNAPVEVKPAEGGCAC